MADLSTLANLAEILGAVFVVGGLGFGVIQLQHYREQRRETAAIELLRSFHNPEFSRVPARSSRAGEGRAKKYDSRVERDRKTMSEWFQWLAERLEEQHVRNGRRAAYEQHRHWRS